MKQRDQKRIVRDLTKSISRSVCGAIDKRKIPEDWDGIELRQLLRDIFERESCMSDRDPWFRTRFKDYKNYVTTNNL
jgi:hypothetical protein